MEEMRMLDVGVHQRGSIEAGVVAAAHLLDEGREAPGMQLAEGDERGAREIVDSVRPAEGI